MPAPAEASAVRPKNIENGAQMREFGVVCDNGLRTFKLGLLLSPAYREATAKQALVGFSVTPSTEPPRYTFRVGEHMYTVWREGKEIQKEKTEETIGASDTMHITKHTI